MFVTVAIGMGVDIPSITQVIYLGPPRTIPEYFQETGRAGRDRKPSTAVLYYNNVDIDKKKKLERVKISGHTVGHLCYCFCKSCCCCQEEMQ